MKTIAIIGTGAIGSALLERLGSFACERYSFDIAPERNRFAQSQPSMRALLEVLNKCADVLVIVCVQDAAETLSVAHALAELKACTVVLCPTISPAEVQSAAAVLARTGHAAIEAPTSGGPNRARTGEMSLLLAGDAAVIEREHSLFAHLSSRVHRVGATLGQAAIFKLLNNYLAAINLCAASEAFVAAKAMGVDQSALLDWIAQSSGQSWIAEDRLRRALVADSEIHASLSLLTKDLSLAIAMIESALPNADLALAYAALAPYAASQKTEASKAGSANFLQNTATEDDSQLWKYVF
jgi:L-threonate 2-dehydrogenase